MAVRRRAPADQKHYALVSFTQQVLNKKGYVSDEELKSFFDAGYNDEQVCEIVTIIAQKTLSNYFNHINDTELDLPPAPEI
jgi:alkylhydroperoxidase family enzyme